MADQITQVTQNDDGSWTFGFTFDNGSDVFLNCTIPVPANPAISDPFDAQAAAIVTARVNKANWMRSIENKNLIGNVDL